MCNALKDKRTDSPGGRHDEGLVLTTQDPCAYKRIHVVIKSDTTDRPIERSPQLGPDGQLGAKDPPAGAGGEDDDDEIRRGVGKGLYDPKAVDFLVKLIG